MIPIKITDEMIEKAEEFAKKKQPTRYRRLKGNGTKERDIEMNKVGKIGEMVGQEALKKLGIPHECPNKFLVFSDIHYKDSKDAVIFPKTKREKTIDFKTAWKFFHKRILIPIDQFDAQPKDLYVGVKIDIIKKQGIVVGFITRENLKTKHEIRDFGEKPAYWIYLSELTPIEKLKNL